MPRIELFRARRLLAVLILPALLLAAPALAQQSDCDCSCESFHEMRAIMEDLQASAEAGEAVMPPPELQRIAGCAGQCGHAWGQCNNPDAASARMPQEQPTESAQEGRERADGTPAPAPESEAYALGEPRDDLERFHGVYGSADKPNRDFFVTEARNSRGEGPSIPPGYLMIGAMWGDVAPWYMKSVGRSRFEQQWTGPHTDPLVVEFETDGDGNAVAMRFVSGFLADRGTVHRSGGLPEGW